MLFAILTVLMSIFLVRTAMRVMFFGRRRHAFAAGCHHRMDMHRFGHGAAPMHPRFPRPLYGQREGRKERTAVAFEGFQTIGISRRTAMDLARLARRYIRHLAPDAVPAATAGLAMALRMPAVDEEALAEAVIDDRLPASETVSFFVDVHQLLDPSQREQLAKLLDRAAAWPGDWA